MAQSGVQLNRERFCCWICLDPLNDPVTTGCGHSYCVNCINNHWDKEEGGRSYSCPQCRQTFTQRPVLDISTMLAEALEALRIGPRPQDRERDAELLPKEEEDVNESEISQNASQVDVLLPQPEQETRADFLRYRPRQEITLDPNTAHKHLLLSEGDRKVTRMGRAQSYPDHPDRFTKKCQVLSKESLTGRRYWEVEMGEGGTEVVSVAVTYENINRAGDSGECKFGFNDKSWSLNWNGNSYKFRDRNGMTPVSGPVSSTVGVYLDHSAGVLSFYSVSGNVMTLLHRVQTTFTEPLYAGVGVHRYGSTAEFCRLN